MYYAFLLGSTSSCNLNCILADTVGYVSLITGGDKNVPLSPPAPIMVCEQC
jgi:hypothetical protein